MRVNAGVPKTLIQFLIRWCIRTDQYDAATDAVLDAILATRRSRPSSSPPTRAARCRAPRR